MMRIFVVLCVTSTFTDAVISTFTDAAADVISSDVIPKNSNLMPQVSNGFLGTVVGRCDLFLAGIYSKKRHLVVWEGAHRTRRADSVLCLPSLIQ
jgi:hypothetical protein